MLACSAIICSGSGYCILSDSPVYTNRQYTILLVWGQDYVYI